MGSSTDDEVCIEVRTEVPPLPARDSSVPPPLPPQAVASAVVAGRKTTAAVLAPSRSSARLSNPSKRDSPRAGRAGRENTLGGVLTAKRCAAVWRKSAAASEVCASQTRSRRKDTCLQDAKYFKGIAFQQQTVIEAPHGCEASLPDLQDLAQLAPTHGRGAGSGERDEAAGQVISRRCPGLGLQKAVGRI